MRRRVFCGLSLAGMAALPTGAAAAQKTPGRALYRALQQELSAETRMQLQQWSAIKNTAERKNDKV